MILVQTVNFFHLKMKTMKKLLNIRILFSTIAIAVLGMLATGCEKEESYPQPVINNVRPTAENTPISSGNFGDVIAIQGSGLMSAQEIWFNSVQANFNPTFVTDNNIILSIPGDFPEEINNQITVITKGGTATFDFEVIVPAPVITRVSNEFPLPGQEMEIHGNVFYNIQSVVFPGGGEGTIISYEPTKIVVEVPAGVKEGKITVNATAGSAESPMSLMDRTGMICDYDALNKFEDWGKETKIIDASTNPTAPPPVDGNYIKMQSSIDVPTESWWVDQTATPHGGIVMPDYPDEDAAGKYALKFEYYSVGNFNGGHIQVQFNWGPDYWFEPYKDDEGNAADEFISENWRTAVIPLDQFAGVAKYKDLKYQPFLLLLLRTPEAPEPLVGFDMNFDNLRVVKIK